MNAMLDDDTLTRMLTGAAGTFTVPDLVLEQAERAPHWTSRRGVRWGGVAAALFAGLLVLQAASTGGSSSSNSASTPAKAPAGAGSAVGAGTTGGTTGGSGSSGGTTSYSSTDSAGRALSSAPAPVAAPRPAALAPAGTHAPALPSSGSAAAPTGTGGFSDAAKIVKTGTIALVVADGKVSSVVVKVHAIADGAGGYVSTEKSQEYGDDPTSTVTIRVPEARFDAVVQQVRDQVKGGVGKVDSASTSGQDVTAQYADVGAQIQSLTAARDRFLVILGRANTIGETLSVQQRVDSVQQQIDSLKGRLRVLKDQTSMGTLTVTVSEKAKAETKPKQKSGLAKSFSNAGHGFTSSIEALISRSGKALVVLLVLAALGLVARFGWRLARRRLV